MKRLISAAIVIGLLAVACGANGPAALGPGPSGSPAASPSPTPTRTGGSPSPSASPGKPFTFQTWLTRHGQLFESKRTEPFVLGVGQLALDGLVVGPSTDESAAGVTSALASGMTATITALSGGTASVEVSQSFFSTGNGLIVRLRRAQV